MEAIVRFSYKRVIDSDSTSAWDKAVFEASWFEYRLQVQNYPDFSAFANFADFLKNAPDAEKIHSRISPSVYPLLSQLGGKIPVIVDANDEKLDLNQFALKILDSDFEEKSKHRVALEFISKPMILTSEIAQNFIVSNIENRDAFQKGAEIQTLLIPMQHGLNVYSIQKLPS
ncbi:MAG: hypothetical protein EOO50_03790 [Flavobacterium sp.]|uniref:hypothetical protein n=1 Tax=Flavobacterium sp. TaxID=239 RepID=UPI0012132BFA|nr:hypothetical protein [Flavobacterium sp.]RZJ67957.1 MAG: hypothetical protein EOO50_03790 [Flavobacterium sp.]